ncbi:MAG: hypothetical protein MUQ75_02155, partial [Crocinitomicaceae bacterium]|nr:hypothetical protein [Crocinitomicaceae bacterium]
MKFIALFVLLTLQLLFFSKVNAQKPNPELSYTQSEKLIFLDDESGNSNSVAFKSVFKSDGSKKTGTTWEFSGVAGKDWKIIKGSLESDEVE